jgi:hypothetical protein
MTLLIFGVNFLSFDARSLFESREELIGCPWLHRGRSAGVG